MLTQEKLRDALDYNEHTGVFRWKITPTRSVKEGTIAGWSHNKGYIVITLFKKDYLAHRLAWFWCHREWPKKFIDHVDCNRKNNAIGNLREATAAENAANSGARPNSKTGIRGVHFSKSNNRYCVQLTKNGKVHFLGYFKTIEEAKFVSEQAQRRFHGEFAYHGVSISP